LGGVYNEGTGYFRLDTIAISSYSGVDSAGPGYGPSSLTAHGIVKNIVITEPPPVARIWGSLTNNLWQVQCWSRLGWNYTLQKSADLQTWSPLPPTVGGLNGQIILQDTNAPQQSQYYRVIANPQ
jgi:hypothetical protein